jgi:hypothetical protein
MVNTGFIRSVNPDATADLICLCCFQTIARARPRTELVAAENEHICDPSESLPPNDCRTRNITVPWLRHMAIGQRPAAKHVAGR